MPNAYELMDTATLDAEIARLKAQVAEIAARGLALDMARGKPCAEQTDLSRPMLDTLDSSSELSGPGWAADNYGYPDGLPAARELAAALLHVDPANVIVSGSSSLHLMYDMVAYGLLHGYSGQEPWCRQGEVRWLCPSPGYDRHFRVTESLGITNVPVAMGPDGPDMDEVARLVEGDASVKGIWCVPKYANPTGITYSDEVVRRFAALRPAAPDFRIFWDNAYAIHDFALDAEGRPAGDVLLDIFSALEEAGETDRVLEFASTAKVTFPGSGIAWVAASPADIACVRAALAPEQVGPEKLTQLMHVRFLRDEATTLAHMRRHADIVRPRFELVERKLTEGLGSLGVATWSHPRGGYFVSFDGPEGSAKAIVALMAELGVTMTDAGATWPYGRDPRDTNIRIAPTFPSLEELAQALDVFVVAVRLTSARLARTRR